MDGGILHTAWNKRHVPGKIPDGKFGTVRHDGYHSSRECLHREQASFCVNRKLR
jgi:hypothetical protein